MRLNLKTLFILLFSTFAGGARAEPPLVRVYDIRFFLHPCPDGPKPMIPIDCKTPCKQHFNPDQIFDLVLKNSGVIKWKVGKFYAFDSPKEGMAFQRAGTVYISHSARVHGRISSYLTELKKTKGIRYSGPLFPTSFNPPCEVGR
jgi:hypothetical protein